MSAEVYALLGEEVAVRASAQFVDVYRQAFAGPPHNEAPEAAERFGESFQRHASFPGFRAVAAWAPGADLVGFGYGHTSLPGQWWHDGVERALGPAAAERWLAAPFVLVELAVRPRRQREGIGGRLHDLLLQSVPHDTAVLSARQDDADVQRLYHSRGWQEIGRDVAVVPGGSPFVILARRLTGHPGISLE